jgi:hypothetical protein
MTATLITATDDVSSIEGVIQSYLDGLHEGNTAKIAGAFHPTSALTSIADDGELQILPRDQWLDKLRARPSPKRRGLPRHDQVLSIDLVRRWLTSNSNARFLRASLPINCRC